VFSRAAKSQSDDAPAASPGSPPRSVSSDGSSDEGPQGRGQQRRAAALPSDGSSDGDTASPQPSVSSPCGAFGDLSVEEHAPAPKAVAGESSAATVVGGALSSTLANARPRRQTASSGTLREPSVRSKLRQGDEHTFGTPRPARSARPFSKAVGPPASSPPASSPSACSRPVSSPGSMGSSQSGQTSPAPSSQSPSPYRFLCELGGDETVPASASASHSLAALGDGRPRRSHTSGTCFREPSLGSKLRQGDRHTLGAARPMQKWGAAAQGRSSVLDTMR
jgi:hypothetical protein